MMAHDFQFWVNFLRSVFVARRTEIVQILDAKRVREGWLQGELFLAGQASGLNFAVNEKPMDYPGNGGPDLSEWLSNREQEVDVAMVAELKVLGVRNYMEKTFGGEGIDLATFLAELETAGEILVTPTRAELERDDLDYLLYDYWRLLCFPCKDAVERILVLVLDIRERPDRLGKVLLGAEFEHAAVEVFRDDAVLCRAWRVTGRPARRDDEPQ